MTIPVFVTRVINPCILIEVGDVALLTDPYFEDTRFFPMNEPIGVRAKDLPPLDAIIAGHGVADHWQPKSLTGYQHHATTDVFVPNHRMERQARRAGFRSVERLRWGQSRRLNSSTVLTCVEGERVLAGAARTNNYVIETDDVSIFVGTEACHVEPIRRFAQRRSVDIAILPIDGLTFGPKRLVMDAAAAVAATRILGASTLVPIHYSQEPVRGLWRCPSGIDTLEAVLVDQPDITATFGPTGKRLQVTPAC